ncbi:MAG: hypothetical protein LKJ13_02315 [Clostridia bacterium]|nr:hypothetical protein [Clostridia bacterium]MCI2001146.1 hypothetical protein [Clostridia bacterium]MCI2015836.1 hypothetical protein [Clostridia bacterium]
MPAKLLTMYRKDMRTPQADFACKITDHVPQRYADAAGGFCFSKITESEGRL